MIRALAVTTDFSELSHLPFADAALLARRFQARLHLLHLARDPQIYTPWQVPEESLEQAEDRRGDIERRLGKLARAETSFSGLDVEKLVLAGKPEESLRRLTEEKKIDLILISTHGFSGIQTFPLGSFAAMMLRLAPCPVLLFRAFRGAERTSWKPLAPGRILVPYDFSRWAVRCLRAALDWAREFGSLVRILSVAEAEPVFKGEVCERESPSPARCEAVKSQVRRHLEEIVAAELPGARTEIKVRMGNPALEILAEADEMEPDLVILSSRGLTSASPPSVGSVAERIIHTVACPVMVFPSRELEKESCAAPKSIARARAS